jgi:hypothetical protein
MDFRSTQVITPALQAVGYVLSIEQCPQIAEVDVNGQALALSEAQARTDGTQACEFNIMLEGPARFEPVATVVDIDGQTQSHQESFATDQQPPELSLGGVAIAGSAGDQWLEVSLNASDDTDIRYIQADIKGLSAATLAETGGVVELAAQSAFAKTDGVLTLTPLADNQTTFMARIPVTSGLSMSEILHDGVVMVDAVVRDAHGNRQSLNQIAFTGSDVSERVLSLVAQPGDMVLTHALERRQLRALVQFEFRGDVVLNSQAPGLSFESSDPGKVLVSESGVVYPLAETDGAPVTIWVRYGSAEPVAVPVTVDYSKQLQALESDSTTLVLPSLNQLYDLPVWQAVFDDGSTATLDPDAALSYHLPDWASELVQVRSGQVLATQALTEQSPVPLTVTLDGTSLETVLNVQAVDAPPDVTLSLPGEVETGQVLTLNAKVADDLGVHDVVFLANDQALGRVSQAPYEIELPIAEALAGQSLSVVAKVTDTAGQATQSIPQTVWVRKPSEPQLPQFDWVAPVIGQVAVSGTRVPAAVENDLGPLTSAEQSDISRVDYFVDGDKVASVRFPAIQIREIGEGADKEDHLFEVWRAELDVPEVSLNETSIAVSALVYGHDGGEADTDGRLLKVVANEPPQVQIQAPVDQQAVTVGDRIAVRAILSDDALAYGAEAFLIVDDEVADSRYVEAEIDLSGSRDVATRSLAFEIPVEPSHLGGRIDIAIRAIDSHGLMTQTEPVSVTVKGDQLPTVALTSPIEGAALVSGLPVELRANAADDLGVDRVDFYVDEALVGSDNRTPYSFIYETEDNLTQPQTRTVKAVVVDSAGQTDTSNEVTVSVGPDMEPPVINWASPQITGTHAGYERADIVENREFVLKVTGYDNVGTRRLKATGLAWSEGRLVLTGSEADEIGEDRLSIQSIPGALNAYSSLIRVRAPAFTVPDGMDGEQTDDGRPYSSYPVTVTAYDNVGNASTVEVMVAVVANQAPQINQFSLNQQQYLAHDTVEVSLVAQDDVAVTNMTISWFAEDGSLLHRDVRSEQSNFVPRPLIGEAVSLDLSAYGFANEATTLTVEAVATDGFGLTSDTMTLDVVVQPDNDGPRVSITSPAQGRTLLLNRTYTPSVRLVDDSPLGTVTLTNGQGQVVGQATVSEGKSKVTMALGSLQTPAEVESWNLTLEATDVWGNTATTSVGGALRLDEMPTLSIRTPAPGSRYIEGESFAVNVLAQDDIGIETVTLRIFDGDTLQQVESKTAYQLTDGDYAQFSIRAPQKTGQERIEVEARDTAGQTVTLPVDIEVLDDDEAPRLALFQPTGAVSVQPSKPIAIRGEASDNILVSQVRVRVTDESGTQLSTPWSQLTKNGRVEDIVVPNPGTLGGITVGSRYVLSFNGTVTLPLDMINTHVGQTLSLTVEALDGAGNITLSDSYPVTVRGDEQTPLIQFENVSQFLTEQTPFQGAIRISDDFGIESYSLTRQYQGVMEELESGTGLSERSVVINQGDASLSLDFLGDIDEVARFVLTVKAIDLAGNEALETVQVVVRPDTAPEIRLVGTDPSVDHRQGSVVKSVVEVKDDYVVASLPLQTMTMLTSLDKSLPVALELDSGRLLASIDGIGAGSALSIRATGQSFPWLAVAEGQLRLKAYESLPASFQLMQGSSALPITYEWTRSFYDDCGLTSITESVTSADGIVTLTDPENRPVTAIEIKFISGVPDFLTGLRLDISSLGQLASARLGRSRQSLKHPAQLTWFIQHESQAHILTQPEARAIGSTEATVADGWYVPRTQQQSIRFLVGAIDRFSDERPARWMTDVDLWRLQADDTPPSLSITEPSNGQTVVPGQRLPLSFRASDDGRMLQSIEVREGQSVLHESGWVADRNQHHYSLDVPVDWALPEYQITVSAEDGSGLLTEQRLSFPVRKNHAPSVEMTAFKSYRLNGSWQKIYRESSRLNYGEFWVRYGETFQIDYAFGDDDALASVRLYRKSLDGSYIGSPLYQKTWPFVCGTAPTQQTTESIDLTFNNAEAAEYEVVVTDHYGHTTTRSFLVHPLSNMAPQVQIVSTANDQMLVAGTRYIRAVVAMTDDRRLSQGSLEIRVDGREAEIIGSS